MYLDELIENQQATIVGVNDTTLQNQMESLGLFSGDEVKVVKVAPLLDPIMIQSGGNRISIRRSEAKLIVVE